MVVNKLAVQAVPAASFVTLVQLVVCVMFVGSAAQFGLVQFDGFPAHKVKASPAACTALPLDPAGWQ